MDIEERPVSVTAAQRSGTTLLARLLNVHSRLNISIEPHFYAPLEEQFPSADLTLDADAADVWERVALPVCKKLAIEPDEVRARFDQRDDWTVPGLFRALLETHAAAHGKPRWGEKSPGSRHLVAIHLAHFPEARYVWIVRDPRAVVASRMRTGWRNSGLIVSTRSTVKMMEAALRWRTHPRVAIVRYESLVADPAGQLQQVLAFLGERYEPGMIESSNIRRLGQVHTSFQDERPDNGEAVRTDTLDRWRQALAPAQVAFVEASARRVMPSWDYVPEAPMRLRVEARLRLGARAVRAALRQRIRGRPRRRSRIQQIGLWGEP